MLTQGPARRQPWTPPLLPSYSTPPPGLRKANGCPGQPSAGSFQPELQLHGENTQPELSEHNWHKYLRAWLQQLESGWGLFSECFSMSLPCATCTEMFVLGTGHIFETSQISKLFPKTKVADPQPHWELKHTRTRAGLLHFPNGKR